MIKTIFIIAFGGAIGSSLRYLCSYFINKYYSSIFPLATFLINIIGCFAIGVFISYLSKHQLENSNLKHFLLTGLCGGFTTFSAFALENYLLISQHSIINTVLYIGASVAIGLAMVALGIFIFK